MKLKLENKEYAIISTTKKAYNVDIEYGKVKNPLKEEELRLMDEVLTGISFTTALDLLSLDAKDFADYVLDYMKEYNKSIYIIKSNTKTVYAYVDNYTDEKDFVTENFYDLVKVAKKNILGANTL